MRTTVFFFLLLSFSFSVLAKPCFENMVLKTGSFEIKIEEVTGPDLMMAGEVIGTVNGKYFKGPWFELEGKGTAYLPVKGVVTFELAYSEYTSYLERVFLFQGPQSSIELDYVIVKEGDCR